MTGAVSSAESRFRDMSLMPPGVTAGSMPSSVPVARWWMPKAVGMEGPVMSASSTATFLPRRAMATAREAVTVLLPTPPLPLTTAMTCLMLDLALAGTLRSREEQSLLQVEQSWVHSDIVRHLLFCGGGCAPVGVYRVKVFSVGTSSWLSLAEK